MKRRRSLVAGLGVAVGGIAACSAFDAETPATALPGDAATDGTSDAAVLDDADRTEDEGGATDGGDAGEGHPDAGILSVRVDATITGGGTGFGGGFSGVPTAGRTFFVAIRAGQEPATVVFNQALAPATLVLVESTTNGEVTSLYRLPRSIMPANVTSYDIGFPSYQSEIVAVIFDIGGAFDAPLSSVEKSGNGDPTWQAYLATGAVYALAVSGANGMAPFVAGTVGSGFSPVAVATNGDGGAGLLIAHRLTKGPETLAPVWPVAGGLAYGAILSAFAVP